MTNLAYQESSPDWQEYAPYVVEPSIVGRGFVPFFLGTFIWSIGSGFSHLNGEEGSYIVSTVALFLAIVVIGIAIFNSLYAWLQSLPGLLMASHSFAAVFSAIINQAVSLATIRYLLLIPAMSIMISAVRLGDRAIAGVRLGITLGGAIFCFYQLRFLEIGSLLNPNYRLNGFLNPNGVAFIGAMIGLSALDYGIKRLESKRIRFWTLMAFAVVAMSVILCLATKSRTATLALLAGAVVRVCLSLGAKRLVLVSVILGFLTMTVAWGLVSEAGDKASEIFQLNEKHRSIDTGTGRYKIWKYVFTEVWMENPLFGVGPGMHVVAVQRTIGEANAHNGLLAVLGDTGLLGTVPLVILLVVCIRQSWRSRQDPRFYLATSLLLAGMVESVAETMFFSIGNPGSLLFLMGIASLSVPWPTTATSAEMSYAPSDAWQAQDERVGGGSLN